MHTLWNVFAVLGIIETAALIFAGVMFVRQILRDGWTR